MISNLIKSSLVRNTVSYSFFNILSATTPFLLIPLLTTKLNTEGYGVVAMFTIFISFLNPIVGFSVNGALARQFFILEKNDFQIYVRSCLLILIISTIALSVVVYCFSPFLESVTSIPGKWLYVALIISTFQFLHSTSLVIWQVKERPFSFGLFQLGNTVLNLLLTVLFVLYFNQKWEGRLVAWLISSLIMALISIGMLQYNGCLKLTINTDYIKHSLKFGIPLIPHAIGGIMIALSGRLIVNNILGVGATGIFTVAYQLGSFLSILMVAFNSAYIPWLFKHLKENKLEQKRRIVGLTYTIFLVVILMVITGTLCITFLFPYFVGKEFMEAKIYIIYLMSAFGFNGMYLMVTNYLFFADKTRILAKNTFIISLINLPICYLLTYKYGLTGASIATALAYFLLFISTWKLSHNVFPMPWRMPLFR
jgi:O-antigen/teichoic acid export membrane protein